MNIFKRKPKTFPHTATTMSFNKLYKGLMERVEKGLINVQRSNDLEIFSYSKSCVYEGSWDKFTIAARGLILCPQQKKIVALAFPKFWNYGEVSTQLPDLPFTTTEKMDGCCHEDTKIMTKDGIKTIKEICDTSYNGEVLSFNIFTKEFEWDNVISHSVLDNKNDWYELELENGTTVKLTGNHKVYLPDLNCYRMVSELNGNETFLLKK
jgi:tRNA splicing ligase